MFYNKNNNNSLLYHVLLFVTCCICFSNLVNGCYITNCPWGGKRSLNEDAAGGLTAETRQCNSCAGGLGTCFGPRICCGRDIGCLLDSKESSSCRMEDAKSSLPCAPYGKSCTKLEFGKCATKNLCCNPLSCVPDPECSESEAEEESSELSPLSAAAADASSSVIDENKQLDRKLLKILNLMLKKSKKQQQQKQQQQFLQDASFDK